MELRAYPAKAKEGKGYLCLPKNEKITCNKSEEFRWVVELGG